MNTEEKKPKLVRYMEQINLTLLSVIFIIGLIYSFTHTPKTEPFGVVRSVKIKKGQRIFLVEWPTYRFKQHTFQYWTINDTLRIGDTLKTMQ